MRVRSQPLNRHSAPTREADCHQAVSDRPQPRRWTVAYSGHALLDAHESFPPFIQLVHWVIACNRFPKAASALSFPSC
eukprot:4314661-Amphidinium_carterae.1